MQNSQISMAPGTQTHTLVRILHIGGGEIVLNYTDLWYSTCSAMLSDNQTIGDESGTESNSVI